MTNDESSRGLFITGTDTGVGKTHVTCLIARQLIQRHFRVAAYKPVCSGAIQQPGKAEFQNQAKSQRWDDIERLKSAIGGGWSDDDICPQRFLAPVAPPIAARLERRTVDFQKMIDGADRFHRQDVLLIEGAGGWLSPVTETQSVADLARALEKPVLVVARAGLGTINHTLLTIASIRAFGLTVAGVVLNEAVADQHDASTLTNSDEIEARSGTPVFGTIPFGNQLDVIRNDAPVRINWHLLCGSEEARGTTPKTLV